MLQLYVAEFNGTIVRSGHQSTGYTPNRFHQKLGIIGLLKGIAHMGKIEGGISGISCDTTNIIISIYCAEESTVTDRQLAVYSSYQTTNFSFAIDGSLDIDILDSHYARHIACQCSHLIASVIDGGPNRNAVDISSIQQGCEQTNMIILLAVS